MMNYSCVSVNLKDQNKTIFETQKEACDYFNVKFGTAILNDLKEQQDKLFKSCERCRNKNDNKKSCGECEKRKKLEKVQKAIQEAEQGKCCYYEWYFDDYKKKLLKEPEFDLFKICGIYKVNSKYEVTEKVYKIITALIEDVPSGDKLFAKVPEMMKVKQEGMIANPEGNDQKKIRKFISRIRLQVLNEQRKQHEKLIV